MQPRNAQSDHRPPAVEDAGYRWAYGVLVFGVLASVTYRSFVFQQDNWELLLLVMVSGAASTFYGYQQGSLGNRTLIRLALAIVIAVAVGVALMLLI